MPSSDIWSAMCVLIQLLTAEAPWEEYRHQGEGLLFVVSTLCINYMVFICLCASFSFQFSSQLHVLFLYFK
jgi:hypothetical protein